MKAKLNSETSLSLKIIFATKFNLRTTNNADEAICEKLKKHSPKNTYQGHHSSSCTQKHNMSSVPTFRTNSINIKAAS
jgi:hypothetical protein